MKRAAEDGTPSPDLSDGSEKAHAGNPYWKEKRKDIRQAQREKKKERKDGFTKEEYVQTEIHKQALAKQKLKEKWKRRKLEEIEFFLPQIAIDLSYGQDMAPKDRASTVTQLHHLYGALRSSERPLKTHFTSFEGEFEEKLNVVGAKGWKVFTHPKPYYSVFNHSDLVYLSPDSPNILEAIDPTKIYVIGGLVDHNHLKGLSNKKATEYGLATAKLPISQYLEDYPNKSLNANHVFEILMDVAQHGDWKKALEDHAPKRKGYRKIIQQDASADAKDSGIPPVETENTEATENDSGECIKA